VVSARFTCAPGEKDRLIAELHELGTAGIMEEDLAGGDVRLLAYFETAPEDLPSKFSDYLPEIRPEEPRDWVAESHALWEPLRLGNRIYLVPPWRNDPAPPGRIRLEMPAGMASGTGLHPATQLAIEGLERALNPGDRVLDLGTGSGILSIAACRLGAERIVACDIDVEAVRAAKANSERCGVPVAVYAGSTRSLADCSVDLLAANISAAAMLGLAPEIRRVLRKPGCAVLTGFMEGDAGSVRRSLESSGLLIHEQLGKSGWACLICEPEP
jgi:ribosomal protein L11 methyltransferase